MGVEDRVETVARGAAGEAVESPAEVADPARQDDADQEKDQDRNAETDDRGADERSDGGVEIDRRILRSSVAGERVAGGPSLAGGPSRSITALRSVPPTRRMAM